MLTVVTVLHGSAAVVPGLLRSMPREVQLVAVDTGSPDDAAGLVRERGGEVVALPHNPGFGAANNAGVARARADVTLLLNPDCEAPPDALEALAARARAARGLHAPRLENADGSAQRSAHPLPGTLGTLLPAVVHPPLLPGGLRVRAEPYRARSPRTVGWAIAACLGAATETLRRLGPFDPGQFLFYEDMDLCLRARAAGVPTVFHPDLTVRHLGGHSTAAAFGGEPHALLAARRRSVIEANLGTRARRRDGLAQALTFATRAIAGRPAAAARLRAQLGQRA
jgi:N-acetylglucosaminyl-diphospho-decaprenol L-rhamnosyltransferase